MTAKEAVKLIQSNKTLCNEGFVGTLIAEELLLELQNRYLEAGEPKNLTVLYAAGQGDGGERGLNHLGEEGLLSRVIGAHWHLTGRLQELALRNKIEAYNLPQGAICQMYRDIAADRPTITRAGLHTFVDPRLDGGKMNDVTRKDMVHLMEIDGKEYLRYEHLPLDYAFIRGTYADEKGNISLEKECSNLDALAIAQAVRNCGGLVFVQVEKIVPAGTLDPRMVRIPGILVDVVVPVEHVRNHMQTFRVDYDPVLSGERASGEKQYPKHPMSVRKMIARRCVMELEEDAVVNLGIGMSEMIAAVADEEGLGGLAHFTIEGGQVGGIALSGLDFGAMVNPDCFLTQAAMFDFYDGGGLDEAFLGMAECDSFGNINVSKFGERIAGPGGFINISQNAKKVVFCGTFTTEGLKVKAENGQLQILREGKIRKFVEKVRHLTFCSDLAREKRQTVLYITERAVFQMTEKGIMLTEIAPGIDLQKDVLDQMDCACTVSEELKLMDARIFREENMNPDA